MPSQTTYCKNGSSMMPTYSEHLPARHLRGLIETLWVQEAAPLPHAPPTTVVPTGRIELIFHYADPYRQFDAEGSHLMARCHVVGQRNWPIVLSATGTTGIVIVRFTPWGAYTLFGEQLAQICNQIVDLELIWGRECLESLMDKVASASTHSVRARTVEKFVARRISNQPIDALSMNSISALNAGWGKQRIDSLAQQFGLGRRQFNRRFKRQIGASPKQVARVLRSQKAIALLRTGSNVHDVIELCSFTDQSHLIRDIVAHSNRPPSEIVRIPESHAHRYFNDSDIGAFCGTTYL